MEGLVRSRVRHAAGTVVLLAILAFLLHAVHVTSTGAPLDGPPGSKIVTATGRIPPFKSDCDAAFVRPGAPAAIARADWPSVSPLAFAALATDCGRVPTMVAVEI